MARGPNHFADRWQNIIIYVDTRLPNEPAHCHLSYKGIDVGQILLEAETKERKFKRGFFGKKDLRAKFEFIETVSKEQLADFKERYRIDCLRRAPNNASDAEINPMTDMIKNATEFARTQIDILLEEQKALNMRS